MNFSTPLPPLPIDRRLVENHRTTNPGGFYGSYTENQTFENDDIYTKPLVSYLTIQTTNFLIDLGDF